MYFKLTNKGLKYNPKRNPHKCKFDNIWCITPLSAVLAIILGQFLY